LPPIVTLTPATTVGSLPFTIELFQLSVVVARFVPKIVAQEFAAKGGWRLAPLTTPEMAGCEDGAIATS
jgi:hypothetical protein